MKKEYINPEMVIVKFAAPVVLQSNSPTQSNGNYTSGGGITLGASEYQDNGDSNESW